MSNSVQIRFQYLLLIWIVFAPEVFAQEKPKESKSNPRLGSADQVDNRLELDNQVKDPFFEFSFLDPYFDFKQRLKDSVGLTLATEYSAAYFNSNADIGEGNASSGMWKLYGTWELAGKKSGNSGALIFKIEHRHKYDAQPPGSLGFDMGYVGLILPPFSDQGFRTTNLYWRQRFAQGRVALVAGFLDVTDFFDVYALASPWMHFMNFNFSTGVAAVNVPNDGYLGLGVGGWLTDNIYAIAGFGDINSDPTDIFKGFDTFFSKNEYFKHLEVGITSSKDYMLLDNIHLSLWHRDETSATGDPDGWGFVISATKYINEQFLPFFRYAHTEDAGSLLQNSLALGIGYQPVAGSHLLGAGFNWGQVNETTFEPGLDDQFTFEVFYRMQLSSRFAVTPDVQYIINPALNPDQSSLFLWGLRGRIAL